MHLPLVDSKVDFVLLTCEAGDLEFGYITKFSTAPPVVSIVIINSAGGADLKGASHEGLDCELSGEAAKELYAEFSFNALAGQKVDKHGFPRMNHEHRLIHDMFGTSELTMFKHPLTMSEDEDAKLQEFCRDCKLIALYFKTERNINWLRQAPREKRHLAGPEPSGGVPPLLPYV